jgi:hypothetical protein
MDRDCICIDLNDIWREMVAQKKIILEPVCKIGKEENGGNRDHGGEVGCSFLVASSNPTELLETIDESLDDIPLSVILFGERTSAPFGTAPSNGAANMVTMEIASQDRTGVAFVCHQTLRS